MPKYFQDPTSKRAVVREAADGHAVLVASRCLECGDVRYPYRKLCPIELSQVEVFELAGDGHVYEAVKLVRPPAGFSETTWLGYVDMVEGVRVFATIEVEDGQADPRHGDAVQVHFVRLENLPDQPIGPMFRLEKSCE